MGGDTDDRSGYGPTYYPGTGNIAQAERITIAAGQTDHRCELHAAAQFAPFGFRALRSTRRDVRSVARSLMTMTRSLPWQGGIDGATFARTASSPSLDSRLATTSFERACRVAASPRRAPVTVADSDINDVQLIAQKPSTIRGRVVLDDSAPAPKGSSLRFFFQTDLPMMPAAGTPR